MQLAPQRADVRLDDVERPVVTVPDGPEKTLLRHRRSSRLYEHEEEIKLARCQRHDLAIARDRAHGRVDREIARHDFGGVRCSPAFDEQLDPHRTLADIERGDEMVEGTELERADASIGLVELGDDERTGRRVPANPVQGAVGDLGSVPKIDDDDIGTATDRRGATDSGASARCVERPVASRALMRC